MIGFGSVVLCLQNMRVIVMGSAEELFLGSIMQTCRPLDSFLTDRKTADWHNT